MVTECVQGIFSNLAFLVIIGCVLLMVDWSHIVQALSTAAAGSSFLHPYHTADVKDFNVWYYAIGVFAGFYCYMSWQGGQGFYSSARTPHEQQMGGILTVCRGIPISLVALVLPIAALAVLKLPEFAAQIAAVNDTLKTIPDEAIRDQVIVPVTIGHILPIGIKGLLATTMLFFSFTGHDTYMHSWGSIFIQDVVMPFRKKLLPPDQHIRLLRWSIALVAVFGFLFSLLYPQTQKIQMFFAITGTIWLTIGGVFDIRALFRTLKTMKRDATDDGRVIAEPEGPAAAAPAPAEGDAAADQVP